MIHEGEIDLCPDYQRGLCPFIMWLETSVLTGVAHGALRGRMDTAETDGRYRHNMDQPLCATCPLQCYQGREDGG